jgi:hypothetical protein
MWQGMNPLGSRTDLLALYGHAERAGWAMGCPFSTSAEFEAAVIDAKRRAGGYGAGHKYRQAIYAIAAIGALAVAILAV